MEFRCRLASANGEIVEGVYVADTEARLRHELEDKGLFVLSLQPKQPELRKIPLKSTQLGADDVSELTISVDKTYVPAVVTSGSKDPRELGVRVFHAFVDPR